jgi:hypothetical protein
MISGKAGSNRPTIQPKIPPNVSDNHSNDFIAIFFFDLQFLYIKEKYCVGLP